MSNTSSKDINYDPTGFNKKFLNKEKEIEKKNNTSANLDEEDMEYQDLLPHKQPIEFIILNIRELFFQILNLIEDNQNPIPYIFTSEKRQFSFALFLIIFGTLLLLLSSLMVSN
jgi:hypothetical protein